VQALAGTSASGEGLNLSVSYLIDNTYFAMQRVLPLSYLGEGAGGEVFNNVYYTIKHIKLTNHNIKAIYRDFLPVHLLYLSIFFYPLR
jgi:hypothetical protein